jgi:hypothetical protein
MAIKVGFLKYSFTFMIKDQIELNAVVQYQIAGLSKFL